MRDRSLALLFLLLFTSPAYAQTPSGEISGTVADASNMPSWAAQAQRFIDSLMVAAFEVELRSILLAESVENEDVCLLLIEAEKALEQEDSAGAIALRRAECADVDSFGSAMHSMRS